MGFSLTPEDLGYDYQVQEAKNNKYLDNPQSVDYNPYHDDPLVWLRERAEAGDEAALDRYLNFMLTEESNQIARVWTSNREDTAVQRFAADARKAGFNPAGLLALGGSPISSSSSGSSYSGSNYTTDRHNKETENKGWAQIVLSLIGTAMMALAVAV